VIGYGNQGRTQALNFRDSRVRVVVGNREDEYADQARGRRSGSSGCGWVSIPGRSNGAARTTSDPPSIGAPA
jgi:predicted dinucleotide-binding enzyme